MFLSKDNNVHGLSLLLWHLETDTRVDLWQLLRRIGHGIGLPWVCAGDFNEIAVHSEKMGMQK